MATEQVIPPPHPGFLGPSESTVATNASPSAEGQPDGAATLCTCDRLTGSIAPAASVTKQDDSGLQLALKNGTLWRPGQVLRVKWVHIPSKKLEARIQNLVRQYEEITSINFKWLPEGSTEAPDIRIAFAAGFGHNSYVGLENKSESANKDWRTMNLDSKYIHDYTPEAELSRVVLHEFGHVLGCVHEHSSPKSQNLQWNKPVVYKYYKDNDNWDTAQVDSNVFKRYEEQDTTNSNFDPDSIMLYQFPKEFFLNGVGTKNNTKLSKGDVAFLKATYPKVGNSGPGRWNQVVNGKQPPKPSRASAPTEVHGENTFKVKFAKPYHRPPTIAVGITSLDLSHKSWTYKADVQALDEEGFELVSNVPDYAELNSAGLTWIEADSENIDLQTGTFKMKREGKQAFPDKTIRFPRKFLSEPSVIVWVTGFKASVAKAQPEYEEPATFLVTVSRSIVDSFSVNVVNLYGYYDELTISWIAHSGDMEGVASGFFDGFSSTSDGGTGRISFPTGTFDDPPRVFLALKGITTRGQKPMRFMMEATDVTENDFQWIIDTWGDDGVLYGFEFSWIAFA